MDEKEINKIKCKTWHQKHREESIRKMKEYYHKHKHENVLVKKLKLQAYRQQLKTTVMTHYCNNDIRCSHDECNVSDIDMLCMDHIHNNGGVQRREIAGQRHRAFLGDKFYRYLIKNDFPEGYQVLCSNHNLKKEILRRREEVAKG